MQGAEVFASVDSVIPKGVTHVGCVIVNVFGDFLLKEPEHHSYGVSLTLPRVKVGPGEPSSRALARCIEQEIGFGPVAFYPIENVWTTPHSTTFFVAGMTQDRGELATSNGGRLHWCSTEQAVARLGQSANPTSRWRDLGAVQSAAEMCLSPYRRVLLMVRELHRMGFERLRAPAYQYPLAWRCPVVPATWTRKDHGGLFHEPQGSPSELLGLEESRHTYSGADGQTPFMWRDAVFDSPHHLAVKLVQRCKAIALAGWGPDAAYAEWFEQTLEITKPHGVYYAFAEFQEVTDHLYTWMTRVERVRLPPPGLLDEGEHGRFASRFHG